MFGNGNLKKILFVNILNDSDYVDSDSSEENSDVEYTILYSTTKLTRTTIKQYIENVVPNYNNEELSSHFRVKRELFLNLAKEFQKSEIYKNLSHNAKSRLNISGEKHILVFLWFAGHQTSSFRDVADRFDLSLSSLFDVITRVVNFLCNEAPTVIKLPSHEEKRITKSYFHGKGFPNVVGAIDGSHIKNDRPRERPTDYFNRKDYHSILLQGVCNEKLKFFDIFVGYPGSVHDCRVFKNSPLYNNLQHFSEDDYILADSAYPLLPNIITPYRDTGHLTAIQKRFNRLHSSCRVTIEHAFGLLKQRFRQLYHLKLVGPKRICKFITACCVLHNLCQDDGLFFEDEDKVEDDQPSVGTCTDENKRKASLIRDNLCELLFQKP